MSLLTFIADLRGLRTEAKRIADALERAYPPEAPAARVGPAQADDISYSSDEQSARQELLDEMHRLEQDGELEAEEEKEK